MKTDNRNRLDNESINALMALKQLKRFEGPEAFQNMVKRFKNHH